MSYCALDDIKLMIPEDNLIQLTDDSGSGIVDTDVVSQAIAYADELIDGYLRGRYTLPLTSTPNLIKKLSIDIAVYHIYSRRFEVAMPEGMESRYKNALKLLEQIQKGAITLGSEATEPENGNYATNKTSDDKVFDSDTLDTFWQN